eukprot:10842818-Karenia_brevis.AAC.1
MAPKRRARCKRRAKAKASPKWLARSHSNRRERRQATAKFNSLARQLGLEDYAVNVKEPDGNSMQRLLLLLNARCDT